MTLGDKIRQLRLRTGKELSQRELAEKIDIEVTYLSKIENNKVEPYLSEKKLNGIVKALNLDEGEEKDLFELTKKISPSVKKQIARPVVSEFLRTAKNLTDKEIKKITEKVINKGIK